MPQMSTLSGVLALGASRWLEPSISALRHNTAHAHSQACISHAGALCTLPDPGDRLADAPEPVCNKQQEWSLTLITTAACRRSYATIAQHVEALKVEATVSTTTQQQCTRGRGVLAGDHVLSLCSFISLLPCHFWELQCSAVHGVWTQNQGFLRFCQAKTRQLLPAMTPPHIPDSQPPSPHPTPTAAPALQRLEALVQEVEPDIYTPDFVAEEVRQGLQAIIGVQLTSVTLLLSYASAAVSQWQLEHACMLACIHASMHVGLHQAPDSLTTCGLNLPLLQY
jgi:hypothetical protein